MSEKFTGRAIDDMKPSQFDMSKTLFEKESSLQSVDQQVIDIRSELLLRFNVSFSWVVKFVNVADR